MDGDVKLRGRCIECGVDTSQRIWNYELNRQYVFMCHNGGACEKRRERRAKKSTTKK